MTSSHDINVNQSLQVLLDTAPLYAKAKAERVYLEEFRKSKKAMLMRWAESDLGARSAASQEREAYAHVEYQQLLEALRDAVETEEALRWRMVTAQAHVDVWRSMNASNRFVDKSVL